MPKRLFDVYLTLFGAPIFILVAGVMAALLAYDLRGNPFFVQTRIGLHGRPFRMYKLRTMRNLALGESTPYVIEDWKTYVFSPPGVRDSRITRWGEIARKTSIDEIPNLINVLKGEMSIVGPRPELPAIVGQYPEHYHRRHDVLPGIAGWAQVNGRSDLTYDEIVTYDLAYVNGRSVAWDVRILLQTALIVLKGSGAR